MSKKINRNDPCPCGSGKKYKQCCLKNEQVKTYTPSGKRKFKAKVLGSSTSNLFSQMGQQQASERKFKATSGTDFEKSKDKGFQPTKESFEKPVDEKTEESEELKTPRFKKIPTKKPGDDFTSSEQDFRVDEK